jgi:hypothetical protein
MMMMNNIRSRALQASRRLHYVTVINDRSLSTSALLRFGDTPPSEENVPKESKSEQNPTETEPESKVEIFPWRHEADPLPRCVEGTSENTMDSHLLSSTSMSPGNPTFNSLTTAFMFLDVPIYQFLFFGSWKEDLADSVSFAFTQSVACLLSNISKGEFMRCGVARSGVLARKSARI